MKEVFEISNKDNNVISVFFEIEEKINSLNRWNIDNQLSYNDKLQDNLSLLTALSEKIDQVFELSGKHGTKKLLDEIVKDFNILKSLLPELLNMFEASFQSLDKLITELKMIPELFDRYKQNISSLKPLLDDIELTSTTCVRNLKGFDVNESVMIEKAIDKVSDLYPVIEENVLILNKHLSFIKQNFVKLKEKEFESLLCNIELIVNDIMNILNQSDDYLSDTYKIEELKKENYKRLQSVISNLNYQKRAYKSAENFHVTHNNVLNKLIKINGNSLNNNGAIKELDILQIADSQGVKIFNINKEYQASVERFLTEMKHSRAEVNGILYGFKLFASKQLCGEKVYDNFKSFIFNLSEILEKFREFSEEMNYVQKVIQNLNEKFSDAETKERAIEMKVVDKIYSGGFLLNLDENIACKAQQIFKIYSKSHFEKNKLRQKFDEVIDQKNEILKTNIFIKLKKNGLSYFDSLLNNLNKLSEELYYSVMEFKKKSSDVDQLGQRISENINDKVEDKIKYSEIFNNTAKNVVYRLNQIKKGLITYDLNSKKLNNSYNEIPINQ